MIYSSDFSKIDMHVHTCYTYASSISLKNIEEFLRANPDFGLAITDINTIDGAKILSEKYPKKIIIGSQIITKDGAITGLFLKEGIPGGKSLNWTIDAILVQDGLVCVPHPMDANRKTTLSDEGLSLALKRCDLVEIFNARTIIDEYNKSAVDLVSDNTLPICGSDAHTKGELGHTYMEVPYGIKMNSSSFFDSLYKSELICKKVSASSLISSRLYAKYKRIIKK
ncbi:MAG: PHP domain-containing protein [Eubacteriales bacterium]